MLAKIKDIVFVLITGVSFVLFGLWRRQQNVNDQIKHDAARHALDLQRRADAAMQQGLADEQKIIDGAGKHQRVDLD